MAKKLTQKESGEVATKGFLVENEYITRSSLEQILDSKNYVTKDWALQMFETFQKSIEHNLREDFRHHVQTVIEDSDHKFQILVEIFDAKIERVQRFVGMPTDA